MSGPQQELGPWDTPGIGTTRGTALKAQHEPNHDGEVQDRASPRLAATARDGKFPARQIRGTPVPKALKSMGRIDPSIHHPIRAAAVAATGPGRPAPKGE